MNQIYLIFRRDLLNDDKKVTTTPIGYLKNKSFEDIEAYLTEVSIKNETYIGIDGNTYPTFYADTLKEILTNQ